jgi:anti-anti-sigma regulatory factor
MGQFKAEKQQNNGELVVKLMGHVDEDATFNSVELTGASKVVVDLDGVTAINSCGIREWIKWIRTAGSGSAVVYRNCPKVIVDQINMAAGGKVESFYVPYYSDASGNEKMILFRDGQEFKGNEVFPPAEVKDDSGEVMEMDVIEAKYFKFLQK